MQFTLNPEQVVEAIKSFLQKNGQIVSHVVVGQAGALVTVADVEFNDDGFFFKYQGEVCRLPRRAYKIWKILYIQREISHKEIEEASEKRLTPNTAKAIVLRLKALLPEQFKNAIHGDNGKYTIR